MNNLQIFENEKFGQVRVVEKNEEYWFVANDVCDILNISNSRDALNRLDDDEKDAVGIDDAMGREQWMNIINEPGLYSLILRSRKPEAKQFKRWITHEVLPEIRKTGQYSQKPQSVEDLIIMQAQSMKEMRQKVDQVEGEVDKVKQSMAEVRDDWRQYVNRVFSAIGRATGDYEGYRKESYILLDRRARADVEKRLTNKIERMKVNGASKTAIRNANKLDIIEEDPRLKEIYVKIVQEMEAKHL